MIRFLYLEFKVFYKFVKQSGSLGYEIFLKHKQVNILFTLKVSKNHKNVHIYEEAIVIIYNIKI